MYSLGKNLKAVRTHYKLSAEEFAGKLGISVRTYSSYEYDERKPPFEFFFNMNTVYDVNLNWLIVNQGDMLLPPKFDDISDELTLKVESILREKGLIK